ncbi:hypothetical protein C8J57DRAFT_1299194 [Mycena rebaudengoi]|nr:hypothetical protein C8J57DRAFT_1299194 [Mycena rebaudengoi]
MDRRWFTSLWTWTWLLGVFSSLPGICAAGPVNVTIPNTSPQIVYTPFICNTTTIPSNPECKGAWASALYVTTSTSSNASANFTVASPSISLSSVVDTSAGLIAIINLVESELTTLTITFIPGESNSQLELGSMLMTVTNATATSSFLPTMTLPPSMSLPTFIIHSTSSSPSPSSTNSPQGSNHKKQITIALSLVLGLGVGLSIILGTAFFYWRKRKRQRDAMQENMSWISP